MPVRVVKFTHPEKVYFPSGYTKGEMLRYYVEMAPHILPHLRDRPVTLVRYPDGVSGEKFYEKNAPSFTPAWVKTWKVARRRQEGHVNYIVIGNVETLAWCANLGAIEFHPFLHRAKKLDTPTHLAFDLDPGEGADILTCIEVAQLLRAMLERLDLECYPKVTGSKGLQLYVPLNTPVTYEAAGPFAQTVARLLEQEHPKLVVSAMAKARRRKRVFIDWSQNSPSKTTVCVYSLRGKHDEPFISTPVTWQELARAAKRKDAESLFFSPDDALRRVKKLGDLFAPVLTRKQRLPKKFLRSVSPQPSSSSADESSPLQRYAEKRDFTKTAEPKPASSRARKKDGQRFVIQKHAASHLHYDFRLEMDGTLKSWAVPKGVPYEPGVKHSAFQVEDHPVGYLDFEGTIPKGQYGGGTVMVWDIGTYELLDGDWKSGKMKLWLHGKKLKGEWHIFRIRSDDAKPVWLIAKSGKAMKPLTARQDDASALTRRSMKRIASDNDAQWKSEK